LTESCMCILLPGEWAWLPPTFRINCKMAVRQKERQTEKERERERNALHITLSIIN